MEGETSSKIFAFYEKVIKKDNFEMKI